MDSLRLAKAGLALSAVVFLAGSAGMCLRAEPFYSWFYLFAWWPYILAAESLLHLLGGYSTLFEKPRRFLVLLPLSVTVWLVFEALNFRLDNWHYLNVPAESSLRWAGYVASFATVLPGLSVTRRLLEFSGVWEDIRCSRLPGAEKWAAWLVPVGFACLLLPLGWPMYFFALVWAGLLFLAEPWLFFDGGASFLKQLQYGRPRRLYLTLAAGLVCGVLWEGWNYWAGAKWYYTVPFVGEPKLFEMPVLGYLGFPPFAVTCAALVAAFDHMALKLKRQPFAVRWAAWCAFWGACAVFACWTMQGIDQHTVTLFRP